MSKISREQAAAEFSKWLDGKRVKSQKREASKDAENLIVEAIMEGDAIIDESKIVYNLTFPLENKKGEQTMSQLKFKQRVTLGELKAKLKGVNSTDTDDRLSAYIAAICELPNNVINGLDTTDLTFAQNVAGYFL